MKLFCQCASVFPVGREGHGRGYHLCVRTRVLPRQTMPPRMPIWQMVPLVRTHDGTSLPTLPFWKPYQAESCGPAYARWNLPASAPAFPKKASPEVANPSCVYAQPGPAAKTARGLLARPFCYGTCSATRSCCPWACARHPRCERCPHKPEPRRRGPSSSPPWQTAIA